MIYMSKDKIYYASSIFSSIRSFICCGIYLYTENFNF
uniref:7TM_GPCR_Srx domain-containing protein n=1 Tax=Heterorhabditis bacteriophora TaxID=37862 RepID=A0A1I7WZL9_HETBA